MKFEIRRRTEGVDRISIKLDIAANRGTPIARDESDSTNVPPRGKLAGAVGALGFLVRDVVLGGPTLVDRAGIWPERTGGGELPDMVSGTTSLDPVAAIEAFECEGEEFLVLSGTGALSSGTAIETKLAFNGGKLRVAQSADTAQYKLSAKPAVQEAANTLRILAERING